MRVVTQKDREILELIVSGMSIKEIADYLFTSTKAVEANIIDLYDKFKVSGQNAKLWLALKAYKLGYIELRE